MREATCWEIMEELDGDDSELTSDKRQWLELFTDCGWGGPGDDSPAALLRGANEFFRKVGYCWYAVTVREHESGEQYVWGLVQS